MKNILVVVGLFFSTFLVADEVLYCVPEIKIGFTYENNSFVESRFEKDRFTVKVDGDFERINDGTWEMLCSGVGTVRICVDKNGIGKTFKYNKYNGRYLSSYTSRFGYLDYPSNDGKYDSDSLHAGKCEKF